MKRHTFKPLVVEPMIDVDPPEVNIVTETYDRDEARLKAELTADAQLLAGEIEAGTDNAPSAAQRKNPCLKR
jgi:hypothetical protein